MDRPWWCAYPGLVVIEDEMEAEMEAARLNESPATVEWYRGIECLAAYPENDRHFHVIRTQGGAT